MLEPDLSAARNGAGVQNLLLFAPTHTAALGQRIADALGKPLAAAEEREFDGGEHKMRPLERVRGRDVFVVQSLHGERLASTNDKLCRLLFFIGALKDAGARSVTACIPYLSYARKDRRTKPSDPVTTRYIAAMLEAVRVDRVVTLDVHNEAAFDNAFRCESVRLEAAQAFAEEFRRMTPEALAVASPDIGGVKRAQRLRDVLQKTLDREIGFAFMEKQRSSGVVSGEAFVGDVAGKSVLMYDDLIASGGTILRAARAARAAGAARIHVAAAHAVFTPEAQSLFQDGGPDVVWVTDSVEAPPEFDTAIDSGRLRICSVAPLFAAAIHELASSAAPRAS